MSAPRDVGKKWDTVSQFLKQGHIAFWDPRNLHGWGHPNPGPLISGVLFAGFPEEHDMDSKHRKLGEMGKWF